MKLYFSPGACSLSPHIVLREAGLSFSLEKTDLRTKQTAAGIDYRTVNPKGYVPALELDDGHVLTEGPAIVQYLADLVPGKNLAPAAGTMERYRLIEWLNFIGTEIHKTYGVFFKPTTPDETKKAAYDTLAVRMEIIAARLQENEYLLGEQFSVADAYLFTILNWSDTIKFDLKRWPAVAAYRERIAGRPAVQLALAEENAARA